MQRRNKALAAQAAALASGDASGGLSAQSPQPPTAPSPGFLGTTPSPGIHQGSPTLDEKIGGTVSQSESLLLHDANKLNDANNQLGINVNNLTANAKVAQLGTPATATVPLFGEAPEGDTEGAIALWGLHGARLAAQRRSQMHGSVRSGDNVDYGGSYMGQGAEQVVTPPPLQGQPETRVAELDGQRTSVIAELETPQPTPLPTPLSTPGMGSYSPSLSGAGTIGGARSTIVSSWRDSSRTVASNSDSNIIAEETMAEVDGTSAEAVTTPELHGTPRMPSAGPLPSPTPSVPSFLQQPAPPQPNSPTRSGSTTEAPRATLDISQTERVRGVHVTSWGSYNP
ncbi:hypothetical protein SEUCBS140593_002853 [Sporothrix eucalyptigena]|uniref:Uncharacterized protein n=1 Tax=Sporothrix eucalyptigena TaxID=1812306 RepID=A0ABP0BA33_9PEZI